MRRVRLTGFSVTFCRMTSRLICPKCHGAMRQYERSGVTVDQCGDCRGIFLDRGELERLVDAENRWHAPPPPQYRGHGSGGRYDHGSGGRYDYGSGGGYRQGYGGYGYRKRKKRSFLDDLFD